MTDKQAFERVMKLMGMVVAETKVIDDGEVVLYEDTCVNTFEFTTRGYDQFYAGAVFNKSGQIVKGYIDSHVAYESDNCKKLGEYFKA